MIALLLLAGCTNLEPVSGTLPCEEVGYAISRRTYECTGDTELANARYEAFVDTYTCRSIDWELGKQDTDLPNTVGPKGQLDYFHCAFAVGELACELVEAYGDDLDLWLDSSEACPLVIEGAR